MPSLRTLIFVTLLGSVSAFSINSNKQLRDVTTSLTTFALVNAPVFIANAVVEDDYEYGKVDAPIGLAVGAGILAILTAAVPVLLSPGEKAFEEMRERDSDVFGGSAAKQKSVLDSKKK